MELMVVVGALLIYAAWCVYRARQRRQTWNFLEQHFPYATGYATGRVPMVREQDSEFTEEELRLLATGAHYQPQMGREEVLQIIAQYGPEKVRRHQRGFPNLPISYIRFNE